MVVDLSEVHPGTLRKLVDIGTERALLEGLSGSDGLELLAGAPLLDPIRKAQAQLRREGHKAGAQMGVLVVESERHDRHARAWNA